MIGKSEIMLAKLINPTRLISTNYANISKKILELNLFLPNSQTDLKDQKWLNVLMVFMLMPYSNHKISGFGQEFKIYKTWVLNVKLLFIWLPFLWAVC